MSGPLSHRKSLARVALLTLGAALIWIGCSEDPYGPSAPADLGTLLQDLKPAINVQQRHNDWLLSNPNVVGTAVGYTEDGRPAIKLYTLTTEVADLPASLEGFPVELEVTGMFVAFADPTARFPRPVPIGVSTGHPAITAGTIGVRVRDAVGNVYALSNNHVYAAQNDANLGDPALQPGAADGGTDPADRIGTLDSFVPLDFSGGNNLVDAAIVATTTAELDNSTPDDGYGTPSATTVAAYVGQPVQKYGRTTGLTHGTVAEVSVTVDVCYQSWWIFCMKSARFVNQVAVTPGAFSGGGDSGSLIVTDDGNLNPVALLFAGSSTRTLANPIDAVLDAFSVTIDAAPATPVTDVAIAEIDAPSSASAGDAVEVQVVVANVGNQDVTDSFDVTLTDETDGVTIGTQPVTGLAKGTSTTLTYSWDTNGSSIGDHLLSAAHDFTDDDGGNDTAATTVTVLERITDIAIISVDAPASVTTGQTVEVDVLVENVGTVDVTDLFYVTLVDETESGTIGTESVSGLTAGTSTTLTYSWTAGATLGDHTLTASHDFGDDVGANNQASTTATVEEVPPPPAEIHVGDIDVYSTSWVGRRWQALVRVFVHDAGENLVAGVTVEGYWIVGSRTYASSCTTTASGYCTVARGNIHRLYPAVTFSVTGLTYEGALYNPLANHDPDGDSDGMNIIVYRP